MAEQESNLEDSTKNAPFIQNLYYKLENYDWSCPVGQFGPFLKNNNFMLIHYTSTQQKVI
jgi:hypothetical protein